MLRRSPLRVQCPLQGNDRNETPVIVGSSRVGSRLYAVAGQLLGYSIENQTTTYQWLRDGVEIADATSPVYDPVVADYGSVFSVRQRDQVGLLSREATSPPTTAVGHRYPATLAAGWAYDEDVLTGTAVSGTANLEVQVAPGLQYDVTFDLVRASGTLYISLDAGATSANTNTSGSKSVRLTASAAGRLWLYGGTVSCVISNLRVTPVDAVEMLGPGPYRLDSVEVAKLSGPLIDNHTLGNLVVGGNPERRVMCYFRATESSAVSAIRIFYTATGDSGGYAHGTGGVIRMRIWPTLPDGITPDESGAHLGQSTYTPNLLNGSFRAGASEHELHTFSDAAELVSGKIYALTCENLDGDRAANWISVDFFSHQAGAAQDWVLNSDWGASYQDRTSPGGSWDATVDRGGGPWATTLLKPCMEITYANSIAFGIASVITGNINNRPFESWAHQPARAEIVFQTARAIRGAYLYVSAREGASFVWCLRHTPARVLACGMAVCQSESYDTVYGLKMYRQRRVQIDFGRPIYIPASAAHYLEIRPIGGSRLLLATNHDGRGHNYVSRFAKHEHTAQRFNWAAQAWWNANAQQPPVNSNQAAWPLILVAA